MEVAADVAAADGYRRFLRVMHATLANFGAELDATARAADLAARSETLLGLIEVDLAATATPAVDPGLGVVGPVRPNVADAPFGAGVAYALEGSSLGAEVLRRRATDAEAKRSTAYFDTVLTGRRDRWHRYCTWLDNAVRTDEDRRAAARGAKAVFTYVNGCLRQPLDR